MTTLTRRLLLTGGLGLLGAGAVTACAGTGPSEGADTGAGPQNGADSQDDAAVGHVHGIVRDPSDGVVVLATHYGLVRVLEGDMVSVGPTVDLMGFTLAPGGRYLASGHPGARGIRILGESGGQGAAGDLVRDGPMRAQNSAPRIQRSGLGAQDLARE